MYAIIEDGSHQFRVREGDRIRVDRRDGKAGDELVFSKVLLITEQNGNATIGFPRSTVPVSWENCQSIQGEENHHSKVPSAQKLFAVVTVIVNPTRWSRSLASFSPSHPPLPRLKLTSLLKPLYHARTYGNGAVFSFLACRAFPCERGMLP